MSGQPRIVATLTTLPYRYERLYTTLENFAKQDIHISKIYLTIPDRAKRLDVDYPPIPDKIKNLCTIVNTTFDYGPIMKIYGALVEESDPETIIISIDDDTLYPPNLTREYYRRSLLFPDAVICGTGALIGKGMKYLSMITSTNVAKNYNGFIGPRMKTDSLPIDIVFGVSGVMYKRKFFPPKEKLYDELFKYTEVDFSIFCNDDILISGYLCSVGVQRRVFLNVPSMAPDKSTSSDKDRLSHNLFRNIKRMQLAIDKVKEQGLLQTTEPLDINDSIYYTSISVVFWIIIIVLVLVAIFLQIKYNTFSDYIMF